MDWEQILNRSFAQHSHPPPQPPSTHGLASTCTNAQHSTRDAQGANPAPSAQPQAAPLQVPLGELLDDASVSAECSEPLAPDPKPTKEGERAGAEEAEHEALTLLHAKGVLRNLGDNPLCTVCRGAIKFEASFTCRDCQHLVHVRCLGWGLEAPDTPRHQQSNKNILTFLPSCATCSGQDPLPLTHSL